jgi:hypothetical protein
MMMKRSGFDRKWREKYKSATARIDVDFVGALHT